MGFRIAIDGPGSSGKSTIAKRLAKELSFIYIDTGAMYRAIGYYFINNNISLEDEDIINESIDSIDVKIDYVGGVTRVYLNNEDITSEIRREDVGSAASKVSTYKLVRKRLVDLQREMACNNAVVMDGRDIGTVVLKEAEVKIYLDALAEERARRRCLELKDKGIEKSYEEVLKDLKERDYRDMNRDESPLKQAEDAIYLDSSYLSIEEVVEKILKIVKERQGE